MRGEHYALLSLTTLILKARNIVEIGIFRGASSRVLLDFISCNISTFDLLPWSSFEESYLSDDDFNDLNPWIVQYLANLRDSRIFAKYAHLYW
tara:strand:+ start:231 stop:509 length:279 start_codon:yes stop_codon:yes gene_type:complete